MTDIYIDLDGCLLAQDMDMKFRWLKARLGFKFALTLYYLFFWNFKLEVNVLLVQWIEAKKNSGHKVYICTGRDWLRANLALYINLRQYRHLFDGVVPTKLYADKEDMRLDGLLVDNNPTNATICPQFKLVEFYG